MAGPSYGGLYPNDQWLTDMLTVAILLCTYGVSELRMEGGTTAHLYDMIC